MTDKLKNALETRNRNTLHGINPYKQDMHIVGLVWKYEVDTRDPYRFTKELTSGELSKYQEDLTQLLNLPRECIDTSCSYGGDYVAISYKHRKRIPELVNSTLALGLCIKLQTKLAPFYKQGDKFSLETSEKLFLEANEGSFMKYPTMFEREVWIYGDARLWYTKEGRAFAEKVCSLHPNTAKEANEPHYWLPTEYDDPSIDFPMGVVSFVEKTFSDVINDAILKDRKEERCMICLDAEPDTMAMPCGHVVVCLTCSEKLRTTPDNRICVKCRCPITSVIINGSEEKK